MDRVALHPLAAQQVELLRTQFGVVACIDDVVWLHTLAQRVTHPMGQPHEGLAGAPVRVGGLVLWPLTIGAAEWLSDTLAMFDGDNTRSLFSIAYAMAHARTPADLPYGLRYTDGKDLLRTFRRGIGCTLRELEESINVLLGREPKAKPRVGDETDPRRVYRDLTASLCAAFEGTTPDYWRWGVGRCEAIDMLAAYNQQIKARSGKLSKGDPAASAFDALIAARAQIIKEHRERAAA